MLNLPTSRLPHITKEGSLVAFLARSGRKARHAIADGNCMFRSLSINLYGHEDKHLAIRKLLVNFEELNNKQFAQYLTASDETTIDDIISNMTRPFVWGTQIELFAITSFFQIPLNYCEMHEGAYKWQKLGPISDVDSLLYPADKGTSTIKIHHFELMYHTGVHYDCVVNKDTNRVCVVPPTLNGSTTYMEIQ